MTLTPFQDPFQGMVILSCKATVGGEVLTSQMAVSAAVWDDPEARKAIEANLRHNLMTRILDVWKPVIKVRR